MTGFILAHDLGTTGNKATLFDDQGKVKTSTFSGYQTDYPHPNWAEQNPEDWWQAVCISTRQLLESAQVRREEIACICFSGQMMGCVPVDHQARPLHQAIIWADTRAVQETQILIDRMGMEAAYRITGHRMSPAYSGEKILWLRNHEPEVFKQTYKFLIAKDLIAAKLTGRFVTDYSDASGTNLFDLQEKNWSPELLAAAALDSRVLPELHASTDIVGEITQEAAELVGLRAGTPVVIGAGDGPCAAVGAGVVRAGSAYNYIGSSSWIGLASDQPVFDPGMRTFTFAHAIPGMFTPTGSMQAAGGCYQWLRDTFCITEKEAAEVAGDSPYERMNQLAVQSEPGAGGLLFFPYLLGERSPYWDPKARGAFFGLTMGHTRADIVRATLEGITFNLRIILDAFRDQGVDIQTMRVIGGGANGAIWRQIMADIFEIPVQRPALLTEATSFGAAVVGGVAMGIYPSFQIAEELTPVIDTVQPDPASQAAYRRLYAIFQRAYPAFAPLYEDLARI